MREMPKAVADLTPRSPLFDMEAPLHRLRGLALLLEQIGGPGHMVEQDECQALCHALEVVHAELFDAWERAMAGARA